ncbi:MAG: putative Large-conductance mechanosensitive channel-like protein [Candidatus Saccharibacteria bacterium]|nr:putative Large-conductance mechanosensitive channel-like protein [Candidatus Saccharibacteria bacterium]
MPERKVSKQGTTVKIESPKGKKHPKVSVIVTPDLVVGGFVDFLREHAIVGLAVGLVIGTQVKSLVDQMVNSFINPLFTLVFGGKRLQERTFTGHFLTHSANFGWGAFVYVLIDFLFVLAAIYVIIRIFNLDKLDKQKD